MATQTTGGAAGPVGVEEHAVIGAKMKRCTVICGSDARDWSQSIPLHSIRPLSVRCTASRQLPAEPVLPVVASQLVIADHQKILGVVELR